MKYKEVIKSRRIALVEVTRDFDDAYLKGKWPVGFRLEVNLDLYKKAGKIAFYTAGHGVHLTLFASHVKLIKAYIEKTIIETESVKL